MPEAVPKKGTGQFMRQGHTAAPVYGNDPAINPTDKVAQAPRDLKP
jgi:hypothetical protein